MTFKTTKLKNRQLKDYYELIKALPPLSNSIKATYALGRTLRKWKDPYEVRDEKWKEIFKRNFGENGQGTPLHENWAAYQKEARQLEDMEVEVEYMEFAESDLKLEDGNGVAPAQFDALIWMIKEESAKNGEAEKPG